MIATDKRALNFLRYGSIEKRPSGWRFGTARIPTVIVERLIASGHVEIEGSLLKLKVGAPIGAGLR